MARETSYLHHLRFPEALRRSFIGKYLSNPRFVILLITAILAIGGTSYATLPRRLNPEVKIPLVIVSTVLPGANPQDVESLVTQPIEDGVSGVKNLKTITSSSRESVSVTQLEFNSGVDPEKARADTQAAIDQVELPEDAITPKVMSLDFENQPVWTFALVGKGDVASLNRFAKILKKNIEDQASIDNVTTGGLEEREISVVINQSKLLTYGISPLQLSSLLKASLNSYPAGSVRTDTSTFALSIDPSVTNIEDVRSLQISTKGVVVPLSSIATITESSKPNQLPSYFASRITSPERSITFNVFKTSTTNIDTAVRDAEKTVDESLIATGGQFSIQTILNTGEMIDKQFSDLIRDFIITIILLFAVLFVFLGARQALVSLVAVPLTFLISFSVMKWSGISLNFLSMFSLLLSLGLLVDDTIVVISAMTSYFRTGKFTPLETGLLVWRDFLIPILTTTLTTVFAFLPLLIASGIIGEFIKSIPIVVSSTLLASLIVAMLITLPLMIILLRSEFPRRVGILFRILVVLILLGIFMAVLPKGPFMILGILALIVFLFVTAQVRMLLVRRAGEYIHTQQRRHRVVKNAPTYIDQGLISFDLISNNYRRLITAILNSQSNRRKAILMVILFSLFSFALLPVGIVKNEFFPKSDADFLYLTVELPAGSTVQNTEDEATRLLDILRKTPDTQSVIADIGQSISDFGGTTGGEANTILFSFSLPERSERNRSSIDIAQNLREMFATYQMGKATVTEQSGGPPAGADVQIQLYGNDLNTLDRYADKVVAFLKTQQGVTDISKSIKPGTSKIVFVPDLASLAQNNISEDQLGLTLRTFASGFTLDSAKINTGDTMDTDKKDITLRVGNGIQNVTDISTLSVQTLTGGNVPLSSLGSLQIRSNPTQITREDKKRTISITGTVSQGFNTSLINAELGKYADGGLALPEGYSWKTGGVNEENQNSVNSILQAMLISFLLIIVTMVVQFGSFRKAIIVMLVIPLSISGVFIIFGLTGIPLSFPAIIGVLALFGIVVKNSILIVDKIEANNKIGMRFTDGIVDGAVSRLEPIALTSFAAIMGLIPVTLSDPLWRGLGGAIISGLLFSGTIMLFFIPVVYYSWFAPRVVRRLPVKRRRRR